MLRLTYTSKLDAALETVTRETTPIDYTSSGMPSSPTNLLVSEAHAQQIQTQADQMKQEARNRFVQIYQSLSHTLNHQNVRYINRPMHTKAFKVNHPTCIATSGPKCIDGPTPTHHKPIDRNHIEAAYHYGEQLCKQLKNCNLSTLDGMIEACREDLDKQHQALPCDTYANIQAIILNLLHAIAQHIRQWNQKELTQLKQAIHVLSSTAPLYVEAMQAKGKGLIQVINKYQQKLQQQSTTRPIATPTCTLPFPLSLRNALLYKILLKRHCVQKKQNISVPDIEKLRAERDQILYHILNSREKIERFKKNKTISRQERNHRIQDINALIKRLENRLEEIKKIFQLNSNTKKRNNAFDLNPAPIHLY